MKKLFILIFSLFALVPSVAEGLRFTLYASVAYAATPTITLSTTNAQKEEEQINKLKDRIASRVAELKLVERRGIIGTVSESSNIQLTLVDTQNNTRFVDVDELTKFASPTSKDAFGISDITKGDKIGILGLYNKQSRRLLARFIDVLILPKIIHGAVATIDSENFTIGVKNNLKETFLIDVQTTTKISSYTKTGDIAKSGFSKIKTGERIMVVGFPDQKDKTKIIPNRIIFFPNLPRNPKIVLNPPQNSKETPSPTATTSAKTTR